MIKMPNDENSAFLEEFLWHYTNAAFMMGDVGTQLLEDCGSEINNEKIKKAALRIAFCSFDQEEMNLLFRYQQRIQPESLAFGNSGEDNDFSIHIKPLNKLWNSLDAIETESVAFDENGNDSNLSIQIKLLVELKKVVIQIERDATRHQTSCGEFLKGLEEIDFIQKDLACCKTNPKKFENSVIELKQTIEYLKSVGSNCDKFKKCADGMELMLPRTKLIYKIKKLCQSRFDQCISQELNYMLSGDVTRLNELIGDDQSLSSHVSEYIEKMKPFNKFTSENLTLSSDFIKYITDGYVEMPQPPEKIDQVLEAGAPRISAGTDITERLGEFNDFARGRHFDMSLEAKVVLTNFVERTVKQSNKDFERMSEDNFWFRPKEKAEGQTSEAFEKKKKYFYLTDEINIGDEPIKFEGDQTQNPSEIWGQFTDAQKISFVLLDFESDFDDILPTKRFRLLQKEYDHMWSISRTRAVKLPLVTYFEQKNYKQKASLVCEYVMSHISTLYKSNQDEIKPVADALSGYFQVTSLTRDTVLKETKASEIEELLLEELQTAFKTWEGDNTNGMLEALKILRQPTDMPDHLIEYRNLPNRRIVLKEIVEAHATRFKCLKKIPESNPDAPILYANVDFQNLFSSCEKNCLDRQEWVDKWVEKVVEFLYEKFEHLVTTHDDCGYRALVREVYVQFPDFRNKHLPPLFLGEEWEQIYNDKQGIHRNSAQSLPDYQVWIRYEDDMKSEVVCRYIVTYLSTLDIHKELTFKKMCKSFGSANIKLGEELTFTELSKMNWEARKKYICNSVVPKAVELLEENYEQNYKIFLRELPQPLELPECLKAWIDLTAENKTDTIENFLKGLKEENHVEEIFKLAKKEYFELEEITVDSALRKLENIATERDDAKYKNLRSCLYAFCDNRRTYLPTYATWIGMSSDERKMYLPLEIRAESLDLDNTETSPDIQLTKTGKLPNFKLKMDPDSELYVRSLLSRVERATNVIDLQNKINAKLGERDRFKRLKNLKLSSLKTLFLDTFSGGGTSDGDAMDIGANALTWQQHDFSKCGNPVSFGVSLPSSKKCQLATDTKTGAPGPSENNLTSSQSSAIAMDVDSAPSLSGEEPKAELSLKLPTMQTFASKVLDRFGFLCKNIDECDGSSFRQLKSENPGLYMHSIVNAVDQGIRRSLLPIDELPNFKFEYADTRNSESLHELEQYLKSAMWDLTVTANLLFGQQTKIQKAKDKLNEFKSITERKIPDSVAKPEGYDQMIVQIKKKLMQSLSNMDQLSDHYKMIRQNVMNRMPALKNTEELISQFKTCIQLFDMWDEIGVLTKSIRGNLPLESNFKFVSDIKNKLSEMNLDFFKYEHFNGRWSSMKFNEV